MSFPSLQRAGSGRADPDGIRERRGPRRFADEAHGVLVEGGSQDGLPVVEDSGGKPMARSPCRTSGIVPGPQTAYLLTAHHSPAARGWNSEPEVAASGMVRDTFHLRVQVPGAERFWGLWHGLGAALRRGGASPCREAAAESRPTSQGRCP